MPRRKTDKTETKQEKYVYCTNRKCDKKIFCRRWYQNAPFNERILMKEYELNRKGECEYRNEW